MIYLLPQDIGRHSYYIFGPAHDMLAFMPAVKKMQQLGKRSLGERHGKDWAYLKSSFEMLFEIYNPFWLSLPFAKDGSSGLDEEEVDSAA